MTIFGRLLCGLGAAAIGLLGLDWAAGQAGLAPAAGLVRFAILVPLAVVGGLAGLLMVRRLSADRATRLLLLASAGVPVVLAPLSVIAAAGAGDPGSYAIFVGLAILCWAGWAALVAAAGRRLWRAGEAAGIGRLLVGAGAGLLLHCAGAAGGLLYGPDRAWPGLLAGYGLAVAAGFMAAVLIAAGLARRRGSGLP